MHPRLPLIHQFHVCLTLFPRARTSAAVADALNVELLPNLDDLLAAADFVSVNCPLNAETEGLLDGSKFALMKPTSYLINTARGPIVNTEALVRQTAVIVAPCSPIAQRMSAVLHAMMAWRLNNCRLWRRSTPSRQIPLPGRCAAGSILLKSVRNQVCEPTLRK